MMPINNRHIQQKNVFSLGRGKINFQQNFCIESSNIWDECKQQTVRMLKLMANIGLANNVPTASLLQITRGTFS